MPDEQPRQECNAPATTETFQRAIAEETQNLSVTLNDVYSVVEKWLHIRIKDRNRIDVILATKLSEKTPGPPIWMIIVGNSGDWKSAFARSLVDAPNIIKLDQITENTLASGKKGKDLGYELQHADHTLLILDFACFMSMNTDKKDMVWAQFRNLYDGFINKKTGSGVSRAYEDCHITLIGCATDVIKNEILLTAQLGTRELMYDTDADMVDNKFKMKKAVENAKYETKMKLEISRTVNNFLYSHKMKDVEPNEEMQTFMMDEANRLSVLRASAQFDRQYRELINVVCPEVPTRLIQQFYKLYRALKSLDDNYPDEKVKQIITHIVNSSGDKIRQKIMALLKEKNRPLKVPDIQRELKIGRVAIKMQCEILWNLGLVSRDGIVERIGGTMARDGTIYGGITQENFYYEWLSDNQQINIRTVQKEQQIPTAVKLPFELITSNTVASNTEKGEKTELKTEKQQEVNTVSPDIERLLPNYPRERQERDNSTIIKGDIYGITAPTQDGQETTLKGDICGVNDQQNFQDGSMDGMNSHIAETQVGSFIPTDEKREHLELVYKQTLCKNYVTGECTRESPECKTCNMFWNATKKE
jgi:hypothetical protein